MRRSRSPRPTWIGVADRCSCAAARAAPPPGGHGRLGLGAACAWLDVRVEVPVGPLFCVLRRSDPRTALGSRCGSDGVAQCGAAGRCAAAICAAPAASRACGRDGVRGCAADRHPTPARTHQPRDHVHLPARHRQRRDYRHGPRPTRPDDPSPQLASRLIRAAHRRPRKPIPRPPVLVQPSSERTLDPVRRDNSFPEKQESDPARLLVVLCGRVARLGADDRIQAEHA